MKYIDFDGVILDTEDLLFEEWRKIPNRRELPESEKIKYVQNANWKKIINESPIINDSVYYLKWMDPTENAILTKVHSLENEATNKVIWVKENKIMLPVIIVPYPVKKCDVVIARGNELVDDGLFNLEEWEQEGGYPILFDKNGDNHDSWHRENTKGYPRVRSLERYKR